MENNEKIMDNSLRNNIPLSLSNNATNYLSETGKWGKFLAILGFCFIGLVVIIGLFAGTLLSFLNTGNNPLPFPGFIFGIIYILMGALYFFPIYYLFIFSTNIKRALIQKNSLKLDIAFKNLKSHYKFIGILTIVMFSFYLLFGIGALFINLFN